MVRYFNATKLTTLSSMRDQYKLNMEMVKNSLRAEHKIPHRASNSHDTLQKKNLTAFSKHNNKHQANVASYLVDVKAKAGNYQKSCQQKIHTGIKRTCKLINDQSPELLVSSANVKWQNVEFLYFSQCYRENKEDSSVLKNITTVY